MGEDGVLTRGRRRRRRRLRRPRTDLGLEGVRQPRVGVGGPARVHPAEHL